MLKTIITRICPKCGQEYLFWLFGRTPCKCTPKGPVSWTLKDGKATREG